eukprot:CAMPEP_0116861438 /NCGR_PEP_ID=MMETSP0418-20121206/23023_1 /TAXON_ID=1158023 /ORGANISM="Astrosyne radiata, Strain 13vi08-1A" /LENGTH=155 /DNA_ID=CAMNT_0004496061 /DNA_START=595 /DNA_END=1058 /DNA_ORIENTATION=+
MSIQPTPNTPFQTKQYHVTDPMCQACLIATCPFHFLPFCPGVMGHKTLILEQEEIYFEVRGGICDITTRRPYGELQSVDKVNVLCCTGVSSSLFRGMVLCPGSGCNHDLVAELVDEMKSRMKERGDTGQIRRTEDALIEIRALKSDMEEIKSDLR